MTRRALNAPLSPRNGQQPGARLTDPRLDQHRHDRVMAATEYDPGEGFREIFTAMDLGQQGPIAISGVDEAVEWARARGYRVREVMLGRSKAYELSSGDGGVDDPPRPNG
jgi:hypothetical protein